MEDMFSNLTTYGYIALFLYSLGGGFVGLMAAGVLSYMGKMDLATALAVAMVSNFLGDTLLFYMARYHKKEVLNYFHKHRRKLALSHMLMKKHGSWIIFMQKFVYGIKTLIPLAIGITKYDFTRFSVLNFFAALLWTLVVGLGSYLAGKPIMGVYEAIVERPYIAPLIIVVLGGLIWFYLSRATKKRV
ncbi:MULTISPECIES: DedA family protein [Sulfurimonas]|uniref:DedA family protein n=1 Tax=Sulfurimonas diazotrophicus TaxID=3131939 RepID=A0ABZ3HAX1_9BACT